jgi:hypothetical protein
VPDLSPAQKSNPTARNLGLIAQSLAEDVGIKPRVEVAASRLRVAKGRA